MAADKPKGHGMNLLMSRFAQTSRARQVALLASVVLLSGLFGYVVFVTRGPGILTSAGSGKGTPSGAATPGSGTVPSNGKYTQLGVVASPSPSPVVASASPSPVVASPSPSPVAASPSPRPGGTLPTVRGFIETSDGAHAALFKSLGFTATYFPPNAESLDTAASLGMKAIVWLGDYDNSTCAFQQSDAIVVSTVNAIKRKSALIGYFLADEPEQAEANCPHVAAQLEARSDLVRRTDPNTAHFTYTIVSNEGTNLRCYDYAPFMGTTDVMGLDIYPFRYTTSIPCVSGTNVLADISNAISVWRRQSAAYKSAHRGFTPRFYAVLQDFTDSHWRRPSVTELQQQWAAWQNSGMEGVWYFSWDWQGNSLDALTGHQCQFKIENLVVPSC
jgi:hypothetical protein